MLCLCFLIQGRERMSKEDFLKSHEKKKEEKPKEIKLEWGKGLAQKLKLDCKKWKRRRINLLLGAGNTKG
ncbi:hypothetical protein ACS0TY_021675 [Phlomoides rotata]